MTSEAKIKMPQFIASDPSLWIMLVERAFAVNNIINQQNQFDMVLELLPEHLVLSIKSTLTNVIKNLGQEGLQPYKILKDKILEMSSDSEDVRITQLLQKEEIGTRTPTQFLNHLRNLLGDDETENNPFIRNIFLKNLPAITRAIIAGQQNKDLSVIAATADAIHCVEFAKNHINSIDHGSYEGGDNRTTASEELMMAKINNLMLKQEHGSDDRLGRLEQRLQQKLKLQEEEFSRKMKIMNQEIDELRNRMWGNAQIAPTPQMQPTQWSRTTWNNRTGRTYDNNGAPPRARTQGNASYSGNQAVRGTNSKCYYHNRYGDSAYQCIAPCSYYDQGN